MKEEKSRVGRENLSNLQVLVHEFELIEESNNSLAEENGALKEKLEQTKDKNKSLEEQLEAAERRIASLVYAATQVQ